MPRQYSEAQIKSMTLEQATAIISNEVYMNSHLFERLEGVRKVRGNGHHAMQKVAAFAENLMKERWIEPSQPE